MQNQNRYINGYSSNDTRQASSSLSFAPSASKRSSSSGSSFSRSNARNRSRARASLGCACRFFCGTRVRVARDAGGVGNVARQCRPQRKMIQHAPRVNPSPSNGRPSRAAASASSSSPRSVQHAREVDESESEACFLANGELRSLATVSRKAASARPDRRVPRSCPRGWRGAERRELDPGVAVERQCLLDSASGRTRGRRSASSAKPNLKK